MLALCFVCLCSSAATAAWTPDGVDFTRPRVLFRTHELDAIRARLDRDPYRIWLARIDAQIASSRGWSLDDDSIPAGREKSKAAKNAAFLYALDRTIVGSAVAPFPSPSARRAMGDYARTLLLSMYERSRIPAQFDDDINTSEELISYATAYDTLAGAGYDFGGDEPAIVDRLSRLATEFHLHFAHPELLGGDPFTSTEQLINNHLSKSASALGIAAIVLAEHTPAAGSDPHAVGDPADWMAFALERLDQVLRFTYVTGDGGYAEGPYYARYAAQNHLPFLRAYDALVGDVTVQARGVAVPNLWRHPLFARLQRWLFDLTLPDGTLAAIDDGNPGKSYYFSLLTHLAEGPTFAFAAANTATPYESEGSIDLAADMICRFDDGVIPVRPPSGVARFHPEGGDAVFRSDASREAIAVVVSAEHGTALELGRERDGRGHVGSASHEHHEPGSFLMQAFGENVVLDAGYLSYPQRDLVKDPARHSIIVVDGTGPADPFLASILWGFVPGGFLAPPPIDGEASLLDPLDGSFLDAVRVVARYGTPGARIDRRFLFPDHRYLVVADDVTSSDGAARSLGWLLHGNGGGTSGGAFEMTASGARWTNGRARVDGAWATTVSSFAADHLLSSHEGPPNVLASHDVLRMQTAGAHVRSAMLVYPSRSSASPPATARLSMPGTAALVLHDAAEDRRLLIAHRALPSATFSILRSQSGVTDVTTDGTLLVADAHADGALRLAHAERASRLEAGGLRLRALAGGNLGVRPGAHDADLLAQVADRRVTVSGLAFVPRAADGACALAPGATTGSSVSLLAGRDGRVRLRDDAGNSSPAAEAGETRRVAVGDVVTLDATSSCDLDGDSLTARWQLVSAPAGSAFALAPDSPLTARLTVDREGPYRVELVVSDARGAHSQPIELLLLAGSPCADGIDDDRDGLFDAADPQCLRSAGATECGLLGIEPLPVLLWAFRRSAVRRRQRHGHRNPEHDERGRL